MWAVEAGSGGDDDVDRFGGGFDSEREQEQAIPTAWYRPSCQRRT